MLSMFISSTIKDLHYVRQTLAYQIEQQLGHEVIMSESISFDWNDADIIQSCLNEVERADFFVLIIGNRGGTPLPEGGMTITRAEYRKAAAKRKPIYVLIQQDTWILYEQAPDRLEPALKELIQEVSKEWKTYLRAFQHAEDAFRYVRTQLSQWCRQFAQLNLSVSEIEKLKKEREHCQAYYRFVHALFHHEGDMDRLLAILTQEIESGQISSRMVVEQPIMQISQATGATLYRYEASCQSLCMAGCAGDADCQDSYPLSNANNYMGAAYLAQEMKLYEKDGLYDQKELILCLPLAQLYVLTLHFLIEEVFTDQHAHQDILDDFLNKNERLIHTFHMYLERRKPHGQTGADKCGDAAP
ncbi:DUF4062 domain-containing protein [Marinicrinis sediminis]|uniref:DUF4062 domain-containing protein n=1 Tax=Marinicrinis sediminis TaxID=1652465 RepID=A0ABW5RFM5_9BACL